MQIKILRYATADEKKLVEQLADWIDQYVIAENLVEAICSQWGAPFVTEEMCRELWLRCLERIPRLLEDQARWLPDPSNDE